MSLPSRAAALALVFAAMAAVASPADDALSKLRAVVPLSTVDGLAYAGVLERAGLTERATDLRLAMFAAHVDTLNGHPPTPGVTLGAAMDGAKALPAAQPGTALGSAWTSAFQRHVVVGWNAGALPVPYQAIASRLTPVRPGGWAETEGQLRRYVATVELSNRGPTPVPLGDFRLRWNDELVLDCQPAVRDSAVSARARAFVCSGVATPAQREVFAVGLPLPVPRHLETTNAYLDLVRAITSEHRLADANDWVDRLRGQPDRAARAVAREREQAAASRTFSTREWRRQLERALFGAVVAGLMLGLLFVGRRWRREGSDEFVIGTMSVLVLAGASLATIAWTWQPPSGEGWARATSLIVAIWVIGRYAMVGFALVLLHRMDRLLLRERVAWSATVAGAWRRALDFGGSATRAEFWGYVGFWFVTALSIGLVVPPLAPYTTLLLLLPVPALLWRRFRGLDARETWALVALAVLVLLNLALGRR